MGTKKDREQQGLPTDIAAERAVVAALLVDQDAFDEVFETLSPDDFADPLCAQVARAAVALEAAGRVIDNITVADEMKKSKLFEKLGGAAALEGLVEEAAQVSRYVTAHAKIVEDKARLREAVKVGRDIAASAIEDGAEWKTVGERAEQAVFSLSRDHSKSSMQRIGNLAGPVVEEMKKGRDKYLLGHSTGISELDRLTAGLQPGQLVIIAARPGMGKSAFALQLAYHIAETTGLAVPFLSYEMSHDELVARALSSQLRYDMGKLRSGVIDEGLDLSIAEVVRSMAEVNLLIDDNPPPTVSGVRGRLRRQSRREPMGAIFIDYLQLMDGDTRGREPNRVAEVSEISRGLKRLATELGVPIIALSQLNRNIEARAQKRPQLSDLRESGSLEQDASLVLFLYRDSVYNPLAPSDAAEIIIAKQRNGASGMAIPVLFEGPNGGRFVDTGEKARNIAMSAVAPSPMRGSDPF